jgi:Tfp pilus assembly protein PilX
MLARLHREERGVALIIALLVTLVIAALALTVVQLSIHNVDQSNYDRKRVQSVNASEAGVDYTWNAIEQTSPELLPWSSTSHTGTYTGTLGTGPGTASFNTTVTYFNASQVQMTTQPSQTNPPAYALITSRGTTNGTVTRTVQSYVKLTPIRQAIQSAITINNSATFSNNFTINGDQGTDGDVHIESGDLTIQNQPNIFGSVYVSNGSLTIKNNNTIHGNAWAWNTIDLQNSTGAILGYGRSSQLDIRGSGSIGGDATAGTSIASGLHISGSRYPNSPTTQHPPSVSFPLVCWDSTGSCTGVRTFYETQDYKNNATGAGTATSPQPDGVADWTIVNFYPVGGLTACDQAKTFLEGSTIAVDTAVRINEVCDLRINNNESVNFNGNLVIFTNGSITLNQQNNWNGQNGNALGFIVNYQTIFPTSCSSAYNITTSNYSNFNNVYVSFYSPCTVTINNLNSFSGQILGQNVVLANNFTLNYKPVLLPGVGKIIGFQQDVVYVREVES